MRYILTVILSVCSVDAFNARPPASSFIRPHTRFMIQSVVKTRQDATAATLDLCQAPTSFFASDNQKSGLFNENAEQLTEAVRLTQGFLKTLDKSGNNDDVRRFDQFREAWRETIVAELLAIHKAVVERAETFTESSQKFGELAAATEQSDNKPKTDDSIVELLAATEQSDNKPKTDDSIVELPAATKKSDREPRTKNGIYALSVEAHQAGGMRVDDLPKVAFEALGKQHSEISGNLAKFQETLKGLAEVAAGVLRLSVVEKAGKYEINYPSTGNKGSAVEPEAAGRLNSIGDLIEFNNLQDGVGKDILEHIAKLSVIPISAQKIGDERYKNFKNYITNKDSGVRDKGLSELPTPGVHAERLSNLTTALNILHMRQLSLKKAKEASGGLSSTINDIVGKQTESVKDLLTKISKQLIGNNDQEIAISEIAKKAFRGAQELGVVIQESLLPSENVPPFQEHLDTHMTELAKYIGNDGNGEFLPQLTLVTNVLWRLHAHTAGFVAEYNPTENGGNDNEEPATHGSWLVNEFVTFTQDKAKQRANSIIGGESAADAEALIEKMNKDSRNAANCMLYGRVDSLLRNLKLRDQDGFYGEEKICTEKFHQKSRDKMDEMGLSVEKLLVETFKAELEHENKSAAVKKLKTT